MSPHDRRTDLLNTLAILLGCRRYLGPVLPDGVCPDVLRYGLDGETLFIGDAKDTETPGNRATGSRLLAYVEWIATHVRAGHGPGILAICFGRRLHGDAWMKTIALVAREVRLPTASIDCRALGAGFHVASIVFGCSAGPRTEEASRIRLGGAQGLSCFTKAGDQYAPAGLTRLVSPLATVPTSAMTPARMPPHQSEHPKVVTIRSWATIR